MTILIIAEHDNRALKAATLHTVGAARCVPGDIHLLVAGSQCANVAAEAAQLQGVKTVLLADAEIYAHALAEPLADLIVQHAAAYSHILAPASVFGKNLLPRVAALLDMAMLTDVVAIEAPDTFVRPIYAGTLLETVQSAEPVKILSVRSTAFAAVEGGNNAPVETLAPAAASTLSHWDNEEMIVYDRPELTSAKIVVTGGRGVGSEDKFKTLIEPLAARLGAAVGASRAAVDAGYAPNDYQVGQTGKVVAPDLYIAIGLSGAVQHVAGIKDSKVIVAVNNNPDAPIFQIADYGIVDDLDSVVPELIAALDA